MEKKWLRVSAGFAAGVIFLGGTVLAQNTPAGCVKADTPEKVEGQVTKIDPEQGKVSLRGPNGESYEFQAQKEILQGYKVGDRIEAKLRSAKDCSK